MLHRVIAAIAALAILPSASKCEIVTLEMTTTASLAANTIISPSTSSIPLDELSPSERTFMSLPHAFSTEFQAANFENNGSVDLNFRLTIGPEILSQTATYKYSVYNRVSSPGAIGATSSVFLQNPVVFNSEIGTITMLRSLAISNLLGAPIGTVQDLELTADLLFTPVPEPHSCTLLFSGLAIIYCRRNRTS